MSTREDVLDALGRPDYHRESTEALLERAAALRGKDVRSSEGTRLWLDASRHCTALLRDFTQLQGQILSALRQPDKLAPLVAHARQVQRELVTLRRLLDLLRQHPATFPSPRALRQATR